jgi:hypothetical protein
MGTAGSIKKLLIAGLPFEVSSDADVGVDVGGFRITETKDTSGNPIFIVDNIAGKIEGVPVHVFGEDGSFTALLGIIETTTKKAVSCEMTLADESKLVPIGGVRIMTEDGKMMTREGVYTMTLVSKTGKWKITS